MPRDDSLISFSVTIFSCISGDCYSGFSFIKFLLNIQNHDVSHLYESRDKGCVFHKILSCIFLKRDDFWMYIVRDAPLGHLSVQIFFYTLHKQLYLNVSTDGNLICHSGKNRGAYFTNMCLTCRCRRCHRSPFHKYIFSLIFLNFMMFKRMW